MTGRKCHLVSAGENIVDTPRRTAIRSASSADARYGPGAVARVLAPHRPGVPTRTLEAEEAVLSQRCGSDGSGHRSRHDHRDPFRRFGRAIATRRRSRAPTRPSSQRATRTGHRLLLAHLLVPATARGARRALAHADRPPLPASRGLPIGLNPWNGVKLIETGAYVHSEVGCRGRRRCLNAGDAQREANRRMPTAMRITAPDRQQRTY